MLDAKAGSPPVFASTGCRAGQAVDDDFCERAIDILCHRVCSRKRLRKNVYGLAANAVTPVWRDWVEEELWMMKVVLVGCGAMSRHWLDAARQIDRLSIVGLVDLDAERAQARAREYELADAITGTSLDAVLD